MGDSLYSDHFHSLCRRTPSRCQLVSKAQPRRGALAVNLPLYCLDRRQEFHRGKWSQLGGEQVGAHNQKKKREAECTSLNKSKFVFLASVFLTPDLCKTSSRYSCFLSLMLAHFFIRSSIAMSHSAMSGVSSARSKLSHIV